jgi:hypothetical protein
MKKNYINCKVLTLAMLFGAGSALNTAAQDCYSTSGCSDYSNFGYSSTTAADLEYDNYVSGFHSTVVRDIDGTFKIWGEMTQADGVGAYLKPMPINPGNYPGLTGTPLKVAIASGTIGNVQFLMLTDDNKLWTWGRSGALLDESLTTNINKLYDNSFIDIAEFQELSLGLPTGVTAADVKMMFATYGTLLITTCSGEVYFIVNYWGNSGSGSTGDVNVWAKVKKSTTAGLSDLTGIVSARGCPSGFVALDENGDLWTWGYRTWDGANPRTQRSAAVQMTLPGGATGAIKMVGMTGGGSGQVSYYLLYENGNLYTLGDNNFKQLGDWTTTNSATWVQPKYTSVSGPVMDDIKWISPQEHDDVYRNISVINEDKKIFNWGQEDKFNLGRASSGCNAPTNALDPGEPSGFSSGYDNSDIVSIETGGHVLMALRECESNFGYVGHRINGSMGDNSEEDECDSEFHFSTSAIQVCGAEVVEAVLNASVDGPQYVGNTVTLLGNPSGGSYAISASSSATALLTDSVLVFTGAGTLRVDYTVNDATCGIVTVSKTFNITSAAEIVTIPGNIWVDADGDAVIDAGESGANTGMWANLTDPNGIVIASAKVNPDGSYAFEVSTGDLDIAGNYSVVLTHTSRYSGDLLTAADTASGDYEYTGTNLGGITDVSNKTGILNIGDLSTITTTTTTASANFGMQQPPTADAKAYEISNSAFSTTPPSGFPDISSPGDAWQVIPMSSPALTGVTGGALSGSDPEDCITASSCSNGATFSIETINSNTRLFYNFGGATGVVEIDVTGGPFEIENFDVTKMVIWAENGSGTTGNEIGFTYALKDQAGVSSNPVSYTIETPTPLPVKLLSFVAKLQHNEVLLSWVTASEANNKGFEIERSLEGNKWSKIGFLAAATVDGNSSSNQHYSFTDKQPLNGLNVYRLKQIDIDGAAQYSRIQSVRFVNNASIQIMPNPTKGNFTVQGLIGKNTIIVSNTMGAVVLNTGEIEVSRQSVSLESFAIGTYFVNVINEDGTQKSFRILKQ